MLSSLRLLLLEKENERNLLWRVLDVQLEFEVGLALVVGGPDLVSEKEFTSNQYNQ